MEEESYPCPVEGYELISAEASNDQIRDLVGVSFEIFTSTIIFAQNTRGKSVTDFLDQDDAGQKEIFSTLFHLNGYEQAREIAVPLQKGISSVLKEKTEDLSKLEVKIFSEQSTLWNLDQSKELFIQNKAKDILANEEKLKALNERLRSLNPEAKTKKLLDIKLQVEQAETKLDELVEKERQIASNIHRKEEVLRLKGEEVFKISNEPISVTPCPTDPSINEEVELETKELIEENIRVLKQAKQTREEQKRNFERDLRFAKANVENRQSHLDHARRESLRNEERKTKLKEKLQEAKSCPSCGQKFLTEEAKSMALTDLHVQLAACRDINLVDPSNLLKLAQEQLANVESSKVDTEEFNQIVESISVFEKQLVESKAKIQRKEHYKKELAVYNASVKSEEERSLRRNGAIESLKQEVTNIISEKDALKKSWEELDKSIHEKKTSLTSLRETYNAIHEEAAQMIPIHKDINDTSAFLTSAKQSVFPQEKWLASTKESLQKLQEENSTIFEETNGLKDKETILEEIIDAFGKDGIVAELFKEYLPEIEQGAQDYLRELTNNELEIRFHPEKELKKKVKGVAEVRSQFEIEVLKKNGGSDYDIISGSEQNKAALVVNWALSDLSYAHSNVSCNLRSYDEIFDGLDGRSAERLSNLILNKFQDQGRITFVVTHKTELDDAFPYKIILKKEEGVSKIESIIE